MFTLIPLLLAVIIIILASLLVAWQLRQPQNSKRGSPWIETRSDLQVWLLFLAAFVAGIFIAYLLFTMPVATHPHFP